ncbi:hypothetical protein ACFX2H_014494 [Malus domestica]
MDMLNMYARNSAVTIEEINEAAQSQSTGVLMLGNKEGQNHCHHSQKDAAECSTTKQGTEEGDTEMDQTPMKKSKPIIEVKKTGIASQGGGGWPSTAARLP